MLIQPKLHCGDELTHFYGIREDVLPFCIKEEMIEATIYVVLFMLK